MICFSENHNFIIRICWLVFWGYVERYLNATIQYFWRAKIIRKQLGNVNMLTVVVFWLAFFGLDASQNCWIYPPSWNEIFIYVAVALTGVPQDLH